MKIEYIYHSGFCIETDNFFLVFDYYKGKINLSNKKTIIFCSHGHPDHFNPIIFDWTEKQSEISYVLSSDIDYTPDVKANVYSMNPYESLKISDIIIKSFGSTDLGLSFLIKVDGKSIFFAGDLNWWKWSNDSYEEKQLMEKAFKEELSKIKDNHIDISFFPVDPRLKENYHIGGELFINEIKPNIFIPMHFKDNYYITNDFKRKFSNATCEIIEIKSKNQIIEL